MKLNFITVFIIFIFNTSVSAQTYGEDNFSIIETSATFEGGMDNFYKVVNKNLRSVDDKVGRVFVQFVVDTTGKTSEFKIVKGLSEKSDAEVLRLMNWINEKYSWKPRLVRGEKVKTRMNIPIIFKDKNLIELNDSLQNIKIDLSFIDSIKIPAVEIKREEKEEEIIFSLVSYSEPIFEGGMDNFYRLINENLKFPKKGKKGRVLIWFVIDTTGKMTDFEIRESSNEENRKETLRVMNLINENYSWKPRVDFKTGKKNKVRLAIFINFRK